MPVRKYASVEEMKARVSSYEPGSLELERAIAEIWRTSAAMVPPRFPPGVYKHRSFQDAERLAEAWEDESFRRRHEG